MSKNFLLWTIRNLVKHKVSTCINLLGLCLGVTACLAIFMITRFELGHDTFHSDADRIYRVVGSGKFGKTEPAQRFGFIPRAAPRAIREEINGLEQLAAFHNLESGVIIPDGTATGKQFASRNMKTDRAAIIVAEPQYFEIFQYKWLAGNPKLALLEPNKVVLTAPKAQQYFGDIPLSSIIGREVIYRDSVRTEVTGIVEPLPGNTDFTFTDFISYPTIQASILKQEINLNEWNDIWSASQVFVKINKNSNPAQVDAELKVFAAKHFGPDHGTNDMVVVPNLQPLSDVHFNFDYGDNYSRKAHLPTLYGLIGVALFILIIAVINFINIATARSLERAKEVGIRKVLGSSRSILIRQFMGETFILATLSVVLAAVNTPIVLYKLQAFTPDGFHASILDPQIGFFLLGITALTALMTGLYPSWILSAYQPAMAMKGQSAFKGTEKGYMRKGLIVFQFVVSLVFILGAIVVSSQINFVRHKDLGFSTSAVITIDAPRGPENQLPVLNAQFKQLAGVEKTTLQVFEPIGGSFGLDHIVYKGKTVQEFDAAYKLGDENFIPFYEMKILAGRNFLKSDTARELVITENFAKSMGFQAPAAAIDQQLEWRGNLYPIVGVVADFHQQSMHNKIPLTFITTAQHTGSMAVKLTAATPAATRAKLEQMSQMWSAVYPDNKFEYRFLDATIAKLHETEHKTAQLVWLATCIAIFISCMGLFGLISFMVQQRTKEIGIRKVLGASVAGITALLAKDFLKLVVIALIIASPIAYYFMNKWLADFAYRIDIEWWMFVAAGAAAVLIAFLTVGWHAVKAALANPVESLRSE